MAHESRLELTRNSKGELGLRQPAPGSVEDEIRRMRHEVAAMRKELAAMMKEQRMTHSC